MNMFNFYENKIRKLLCLFKRFKTFIPSYPFKIINHFGNTFKKNILIRYQVSGKSSMIEERPEKLVLDLAYIKGFSKIDSNLILELFIAEAKAPSFKIKNIFFEENTEKFEIEDLRANRTMLLTASSILQSEELIQQFGHKDFLTIYHLFNTHSLRDEKMQLNQMKSIMKNGNLYVINR